MPTWTSIATTWATEPSTWAGSLPPPPAPVVQRWKFYDPLLGQTYEFEINPSEGSPTYGKRLVRSSTLASSRKTLLVEGSAPAKRIDLTGVSLSSAQLDTFVNWFNRRRPIRLTDDLGRQWMVYIYSVEPQRKRNVTHPYQHHYKISTVVVD